MPPIQVWAAPATENPLPTPELGGSSHRKNIHRFVVLGCTRHRNPDFIAKNAEALLILPRFTGEKATS